MIIYKITNLINNKIYIGKSIKNDPNYLGSGLLINRSIEKYGIKNFKKDIIEESISTIDELNEKEKYWIKYFNSTDLNIGYNIAYGGDGGDLITNNPNKEHFLEYCKNRKGEKNGMFGKKHRPDSIKKMSENKKGQNKGRPTWNKGLNKNNYSDEYREKLSKKGKDNINSFSYELISPEKKKIILYGNYELDNFSNENDICSKTLRYFINKGVIKKLNKKPKDYRRNNLIGWEIKLLNKKKKLSKKTKKIFKNKTRERLYGENNINAKTFYLISPKNETFEVIGQLPTFCKIHNINYYVIKRYINKGKILSSGRYEDEIRKNTIGWEIKTNMNIIVNNDLYYFTIISPHGKEYKIHYGLKKFCREYNLSYDVLRKSFGKIKPPIKNFSQERINTTGWEIIKIINQ